MPRTRFFFNLRQGETLVHCYTFLDPDPDIDAAYAKALDSVLNLLPYARPLPKWDTLAIWRVGARKVGRRP